MTTHTDHRAGSMSGGVVLSGDTLAVTIRPAGDAHV